MSYELMSKRLNAVIPDETWDALEKVATRELRTKSQMAAILLGEAIAEYWRRNPPEPEPEPEPEAPPPKPTATTKQGRVKGKG
jgi:hypothetical protein